jgi:hypothetical protein
MLLLTGVVAVFLAGIRMGTLSPNPPPGELIVAAGIAGLLGGWFLGVNIASRQASGLRGVFCGLAAGTIFGPPSVILLVMPRSLPVVAVGSVVLLVFAVLARVLSQKSAEPPQSGSE